MLSNSFKPCCYNCNDLDFDYSCCTMCVGLVERQDYHIFCKHYHVCKKYIDYDTEPSKQEVEDE